MTKEKRHPFDLAILGGQPALGEALHVGGPNIANRIRLMRRIEDILDRRWLTNNGPYVQEFERRLCKILDAKDCIAVCSGTQGLEIAIRAMGLTGEVILPSFTFIATAHAVQWHGITPVFCDIDPSTHNISPHRIEELITPRTTGIIGVHLWSRPCDVDFLEEIACRRNLKLLFDAAHAFGCSCKGRMIANFGDAEVFSFHATKFINTFEGGAIATNDEDLAIKIRTMRNFGFAGLDNVISLGTNGKMNEVSAAMGLTMLESMDEIIQLNRRNYHAYRDGLANLPGVKLISYDESEHCNFHYIVIEIDETKTHVSRDMLIKILNAENVRARRYFFPGCHRMEPYRSIITNARLLLPETDRLVHRVIALPTGTAVGLEEIRSICDIIRFVLEHFKEISLSYQGHLDFSKKSFNEGSYVNKN